MPLQNSKQTEAVTSGDVEPGKKAWSVIDTALAGDSRDFGLEFRGLVSGIEP